MSMHDLRLAAARRMSRLPELARTVRQRHRAALQSSSVLSSRLTVEQLEPRLLLSADAPPIQGAIDIPGETDSYTINIAEPGSLAMGFAMKVA